ncbi:hypothetical protein [Pseudomonas graminis]|uniref:Uncharacterized protein n=1 Tax=Pseudomonas graminis TaxID=158627 RepID=A0A1I0DZZ8_9PSED|nr:hypothetical protein [Pseudomonas graminis]SET38040.1 hypothetical protein SAMN05216197_1129 [Pseudomonas graminis]
MTTNKAPTLRELNRQYSPDRNTLIEDNAVITKRRYVRTGRSSDLVNTLRGEVSAVATIHTVEGRDDAEFVKVFAAGVQAMYGLTKTGVRVFQAILDEYQNTSMTGGFADLVYLYWFGNGLNGRVLDMGERTFHTGFKALLLNRFLAPRSANLYWVNSALFSKGDRVKLITEYRKKGVLLEAARDPKTLNWVNGGAYLRN